ncbi:MAG: four helix bundle protein [Bacteroidota bacterium]
MASIKRFEDIEAWQLARQLSNNIYQLTGKGTFVKDFGLKNQIRNAAGSVMDNIAEGFGRSGNKEFINFLSYSMGSAAEVQSQLYRARDARHISEEEFKKAYLLANRISKANNGLLNYLKKSEIKGTKFKR